MPLSSEEHDTRLGTALTVTRSRRPCSSTLRFVDGIGVCGTNTKQETTCQASSSSQAIVKGTLPKLTVLIMPELSSSPNICSEKWPHVVPTATDRQTAPEQRTHEWRCQLLFPGRTFGDKIYPNTRRVHAFGIITTLPARSNPRWCHHCRIYARKLSPCAFLPQQRYVAFITIARNRERISHELPLEHATFFYKPELSYFWQQRRSLEDMFSITLCSRRQSNATQPVGTTAVYRSTIVPLGPLVNLLFGGSGKTDRNQGT